VYLTNMLPANLHPALRMRDYAFLTLYAGSFLFEIIADSQKSAWRKQKDAKEHNEKFISSGLWSISRHPNYVGEVGIWAGLAGLSTVALQSPYFPRWTPALAAVSPLVTYLLLRYASGVPPLERSGHKKYGDDPKYKEYVKTVPVFWPFFGSAN